MADGRREPTSKYTEDRGFAGAFEGETVTRRRVMTLTAHGAGAVAVLSFTLPALYTVTTKTYDVRDTMSVVWNTPAGGVSGSGAIVNGAVDWTANASTPGATGTLAWNAGTQTYTYSHLSSSDIYTIAVNGTTGVIDNMAHAGASGTRPTSCGGDRIVTRCRATTASWTSPSATTSLGSSAPTNEERGRERGHVGGFEWG